MFVQVTVFPHSHFIDGAKAPEPIEMLVQSSSLNRVTLKLGAHSFEVSGDELIAAIQRAQIR